MDVLVGFDLIFDPCFKSNGAYLQKCPICCLLLVVEKSMQFAAQQTRVLLHPGTYLV